MAFQTSDKIILERGGIKYHTTGQDVLNLVTANVGTSEFVVADIAARNALTGVTLGDRIMVTDASNDGTVTAGWAIYAWNGVGYTKIASEEGTTIEAGTANLTYQANPTSGVVTSDNGTDATIPAADGTNAGFMTPAQFEKLADITVTQPLDLDAIDTASHAEVTVSGAATTNPITLAGQILSFSIANLTAAP